MGKVSRSPNMCSSLIPLTRRLQQNRATFHDKVANALEQGDLAGALKGYRESLALRERLAQAAPETPTSSAPSLSPISGSGVTGAGPAAGSAQGLFRER